MPKIIETQYRGDGLEESNRLSILAMIMLVFFLVAGIGWATYLFVDASGISNYAGVHITKNLLLAADDLRGKLYTDESRGIKDWMIHTDSVNGFEIKHPNDWEMQSGQKEEGVFLFLRTYKSGNTKSKSLLMSVEVRGSDEAIKGNSLRDIITKEGFTWQNDWKEKEINGRMGIRTGKYKTAEGLLKDAVFWKEVNGQKSFYLEATYYTDNINDAKYGEAVFENVISEFKLL